MSPLSATQLRPASLRRSPNLGAAAALVALAVVLLAAGLLVRAPSFVGQVTFVNRTPFDLNAQVDNGHADDTLLLGVAQPDQVTPVYDVVDQGSTWVFTFSRGGVTAGTLRLTSSQLEAHHWRVEIPASFAVPLQAAGQEPQPH